MGKIYMPDDVILAIGKRYFELTSGKETNKNDINTKELIIKDAKNIKDYCNGYKACDNCPFYVCPPGSGHYCTFSRVPGRWDV